MAEQLFIRTFNMSLTGSFAILAVLAMRLALRKAPGIFSYCLWAVVLFRLLCPVSFTAGFSPLNALQVSLPEHGRIEYIPEDILLHSQSKLTPSASGAGGTEDAVFPDVDTAAGHETMNGAEPVLTVLTALWLTGICAIALYSAVTLARFAQKLRGAVRERDNIYVTGAIATPFVIGVIRPRIYLPALLGETEKRYILLHEQIHLKRGDHILKIVSFTALCLHWFNPLAWAAFFLSGKDMEMSCDEAVIRKIGSCVKREYSTSLLCLSTGKRIVNGVPLAFGEGDTGSRIRNVLRYKKPATLAVGAAAVICAVTAVILLANPESPIEHEETVVSPAYYGVISDTISEGISYRLLLCPGIGEMEIPASVTIDTYFEPGDTRDPHELLPGDLVCITFPSGEDKVNVLDTVWPAQFSAPAESIMINWQGISLKDTGNGSYLLTFPGGIIPDISKAKVGDILSIYQETQKDVAYLPQAPKGEHSSLIASTPILNIEENEFGGRMLTIELPTPDIQQVLAGLCFYIQFSLETDEADENTLPLQSDREMTDNGVYRVSIRSVSRSARTIDRYVSDYESPFDGTTSLAFAENCTFKANYSMDTPAYEEVSFDTFADLIAEGSEWQNNPCLLHLEDNLIVEASLDSALLHYGISYDYSVPQSYIYDYLLEHEGADAFDTCYSLVSMEFADIADSAGRETVEIYTGNSGDGDSGVVMFRNAAGELLYMQDAHASRAGWNNIYLGEMDGTHFIMNVYVEDRWDFGAYGYWVYRLGEEGGIRLIAGSLFEFGEGKTYDDDMFREWVDKMTAWLKNSHLILSSQEGEIRTEKVSDADRYNYDTLSLKDREL